MAVSKTQNERPAILSLIDLANQLEGESNTHARNIETLTDGLADEVSDREAADTLLGEAIQDEAAARAQAVQAEATARAEGDTTITNSLGATNEQVDALQLFVNRFRIGLTQQFTVAPNDGHTGTVTFDTPFANDAQVLVLPNCVGSAASFGTLECQLIDASNIGFNFGVYNSDSDNSYTISVGFVAVQVN